MISVAGRKNEAANAMLAASFGLKIEANHSSAVIISLGVDSNVDS